MTVVLHMFPCACSITVKYLPGGGLKKAAFRFRECICNIWERVLFERLSSLWPHYTSWTTASGLGQLVVWLSSLCVWPLFYS